MKYILTLLFGLLLGGALVWFFFLGAPRMKPLAGTPVRVSNVEPGLVGGTEFSTTRFGGDAGKAAKVYEGTDALTAEDIAETVGWIVNLSPHVNINRVELMPTCQGPGPFTIKRR